MPRPALKFLCATLVVCLLALFPVAQTSGPPPVVKSIQLVEDHGAPAIEILSTGGRITPEIQTLTSPPRLLIDLPNSRLGAPPKRTAIDQQNVLRLLLNAARNRLTLPRAEQKHAQNQQIERALQQSDAVPLFSGKHST